MHVLGVQMLSMTCLFVSMVGIFFLPYCFMNGQHRSFDTHRYQFVLSLANCFSGGVFIATFFVGLMPEVRELFHEFLNTSKIETGFPLTEFVIFLGFFLSLGIEQFVLEYREKRSATYTSISSRSPDDCNKNESNIAMSRRKPLTEESAVDCDSDNFSRTALMTMKEDSTSSSHICHTDHTKTHVGHSHSDLKMYITDKSGIRLGMLMISLGVHSLFEGLALGLQTDIYILINLVIGVAVHELLVAFAMGVNISRLQLPRATALKLALIFSASIPAGQVLGVAIGQFRSPAATASSAVLQGLAAGTFIHVTFFEVIPAEFHESGFRIFKVLSIGFGYILLLICTVSMNNLLPHKT